MTAISMLFATDGSSGADEALGLLLTSFDPAGVHVVEVMSVTRSVAAYRSGAESRAAASSLATGHQQAAEAVVHLAAQRLRDAGFRVVETIRSGHPADSIVNHVTSTLPDIVVLGSRGLGGLRRPLIGSVSGKVVRYAPTSVLVARTSEPIRRVVLGYDASPDADRALELITTLPLMASPAISVCTTYEVVAPFRSGIAPTMIAQVNAAYRDSLRWAREAAEAIAAIAVGRFGERGFEASSRIAQGSPHEQLAIAVGKLGADLVVVGSRGLSGIERFFLGSTSATLVAQPPTSVLVARSIGEPQ